MSAALARERRLSEAFRRHVPRAAAPGPAGLLGLELEFSVRFQQGARVHFGWLIHRLALEGRMLDPGDPNAYRCTWGGVITADGGEAEIATPPVRMRPGFTGELEVWAQTGEAELRRALPPGLALDGYSAHFSAAMPEKLNDRVCQLYAETFAAGLMLLTDRTDSPGLLVRPRPGRTELCGEFVTAEALPAAAAFVAGSARACAAAVGRHRPRPALPPALDVRLAPAVHRYGWYVDRGAFGTDLHTASRRALLPRASGGTICAQSHLELAWVAARQALAGDAAASDLQAAEAMVTGALPLPAENRKPGRDIRFPASGSAPHMTPEARLYARVRPGFTVRPVAATWDFTVFEASGPARTAYVCIPRDSLPGFTDSLDAGALDDAITAYLALPSRRRALSAHRQTRRPGLYDQLGAPATLVAPERDPQTGRREPGAVKGTLTRPGKRQNKDDKPPDHVPGYLRKVAAIGGVAAVLAASAGVATAVLRHRPSPPNDHHAPLITIQPSALSFSQVLLHSTATKWLTITNPGHTRTVVKRMVIAGSAAADFSARPQDIPGPAGRSARSGQQAPRTCPRSLQPGQECKVEMAFTPSALGLRTATLRIYLASRPKPQEVSLTGQGIRLATSPLVSVTAISPATGPATGGTHVTITGSGLAGATSVYFGTIKAPAFTGNSAAQLTATSPPGTGTVHVTVATPRGQSAPTNADQFSYVTPPAVSFLKPPDGLTTGGTHVTIIGRGFTGATGVYFGSMKAPAFAVISDTQITTISPPSASPGVVYVTVVTPGGASPPNPHVQFHYLTPPPPPAVKDISPTSGPAAGGTSVTISGTGFTGATAVDFASTPATTFTVNSDTRITATSPAGSGTVNITVTTPDGTSAPGRGDQFTYV
jgi:hypothetical protein